MVKWKPIMASPRSLCRKAGALPLFAVLLVCCSFPQQASSMVYSVDPLGNDAFAGTWDLPFATIQRAADAMQPGDSVWVRPGTYAERVTTRRHGAEGARIIFQAMGDVRLRGFLANHAHTTFQGFTLTDHSATTVTDGYIRLGHDGDFFELLDCTVRDGFHTVRPDTRFEASTGRILSEQGGFLDVGFAPGQRLYVFAATNDLSINAANRATHTITEVTDHAITVGSALVDQGPMPIYLTASYQYGLYCFGRSSNAVISGNRFRHLGYDAWYIHGTGHLISSNVIEHVGGWDAMHFTGTNHVFVGNIVRDSPLVVYQVSPDAWENGTINPYENILFSNNVIYGFSGVLASLKDGGTSRGLTFRDNVFVDVGRFIGNQLDTIIENNTFLRVAKTNTPVTSVARHPLRFEMSQASNVVIRNNVFLDCGQTGNQFPEPSVGWYEFIGSTSSVVVEGNFVAGSPPNFAAKTGFGEDPLLNGGDPLLFNFHDPLGPDGIPFTEDDGLRHLPISRLIEAGVGGVTIGAYSTPVSFLPDVLIDFGTGRPRVFWQDTGHAYFLERSLGGNLPWLAVTNTPVVDDGLRIVEPEAEGETEFFRLNFY